MVTFRHSIRKQTIDLGVTSEADALRLHPRLSDINRRHLLPVIERVFDEFELPEHNIRIDRLDLDLGSIPIDRFEDVAQERLYHALRDALAEAIRGSGQTRAEQQRHEMSRLELLQFYLTLGRLPFWGPSAAAFSLEALIGALVADHPDLLAQTLRKLGHQRRVLERIVHQLDDATLGVLVRLLEPKHAALIIAYVLETREIHRVERILPLSDKAFSLLVWVLTLAYLTQSAATQFNRKVFIKSLLIGFAGREGLGYPDVLQTLVRALVETRKRHPLRTSLPAVLAALMEDLPSTDGRAASEEQPDAGWPRAAAADEGQRASTDGGPAADGGRAAGMRVAGDGPGPRVAPGTKMGRSETDGLSGERVDIYDPSDIYRLVEDAAGAGGAASQPGAEDAGTAGRGGGRRPDGAEARGTVDASEPEGEPDPGRAALGPQAAMAARQGRSGAAGAEPARDGQAGAGGRAQPPGGAAAASDGDVGGAGTAVGASGDESGDRALVQLGQFLRTGRLPAEGPDAPGQRDTLEAALRQLAARRPGDVRAVIRGAGGAGGPAVPELIGRLTAVFRFSDLVAVLAAGKQVLMLDLVRLMSDAAAVAAGGRRVPIVQADIRVAIVEYLLTGRLDQAAPATIVRETAEHLAARLGIPEPALSESLRVQAARQVRSVSASSARAVEAAVRADSDRQRLDADSIVVFDRYDQIELLRAYLRHGVAPWTGIVRATGWAADRALERLLQMSRPMLEAVFAGDPDRPRLVMLVRALGGLSQVQQRLLLRRLIPWSADSDSPAGTALWTAAEAAPDRAVFLGRVIDAVLEGEDLDFDDLTTSPPVPGGLVPKLPPAPATWDAGTLKSVLLAHARDMPVEHLSEHRPADLLEALLATYPQDLREFMLDIRAVPGALAGLARHLGDELIRRLLVHLAPEETVTLFALFAAIVSVPQPYRPARETAVAALLLQVLRAGAAGTLSQAGMEQVLRDSFGVPVADQVTQSLVRTAGGWSSSAGPEKRHAATLKAATAAAAADSSRSPAPPTEAGRSPRRTADPETLEAVVRLLSGKQAGVAPDGKGAKPLSPDAVMHLLVEFLETPSDEIRRVIRSEIKNRRTRERWSATLGESALVRIVAVLEPHRHRALLFSTELLATAWTETASHGLVGLARRRNTWRLLLDFLAENEDFGRSTEHMVAAFFQDFGSQYRAATDDSEEEVLRFGERFLEHAGRLAHQAGRAELVAVFRKGRDTLLGLWQPRAGHERPGHSRPSAPSKPTLPSDGEADESRGETIYVENAGLVLAAPFLPHLFGQLDLLKRDDSGRTRIRDAETASRAVHLLQYLVDGRTSAPEPLLVLNKLLAGVPLGTPVDRAIEPTERERELCDFLLESMIKNWESMEDSSIDAIRETFLQREGRLEDTGETWRLTIQRKTLDVLVDRVTWGFRTIIHPWMNRPISVDW